MLTKSIFETEKRIFTELGKLYTLLSEGITLVKRTIRQRIKMEAPNNTELNLDALCDLLEDDEEELVENIAPHDKVQDKTHTANDSKNENNTPKIPATQPR